MAVKEEGKWVERRIQWEKARDCAGVRHWVERSSLRMNGEGFGFDLRKKSEALGLGRERQQSKGTVSEEDKKGHG